MTVRLRRVFHFIVNMSVLQIDIGIHSTQNLIVNLGIDIEVSLLGLRVVILKIGHPHHIAEMLALILVPATAQGSLYPLAVVIDQ